MKILVFSDLHAHNFKEFSEPVVSEYSDQAVNSRLLGHLRVLSEIGYDIDRYNCRAVLFLGDMYHLKNNLDSQVIELVTKEIAKMSKKAILYFLPGNHDYRLWSDDAALLRIVKSAGDNALIMTEGMYKIGNLELYAFPNRRKAKRLEGVEFPKADIFLGHQDIKGVHYGGFTVEWGLDADAISKNYQLALIGHCHKKIQVRKNVWSVGSPIQISFSEVGEEKGWWILDTENLNMEYVENTFSPEFKVLKEPKENICPDEKNYYNLIVKGLEAPADAAVLKWKRITFLPTKADMAERSDLRFSDSMADLLAKYIKSKNDGLNETRLIETGMKYLK